MLDKLDTIDWTSLTHAYGSAEDVPALIRARASEDPTKASEAQSELFGNIWHQGTVYEATAFAVPFLVELLERKETKDRAGLVMLLTSIAQGLSYLEVHGDLLYFKEQDQNALHEKQAEELRWKSQARDAVQQPAPVYWRLLNDPSLRVCVPCLLAKLPAETERIHERIPALFCADSEPTEVASLLTCLAVTSKRIANPFSKFSQFLRDVSPIVRLSAALGVLMTGVESSDLNRSLDTYFEALREPDEFETGDETWLWGAGEIWSFLMEVHPLFSKAGSDVLVKSLPNTLPTLDSYTACCLAAGAMLHGFDPHHLPQRKVDLTDLQLALLHGLARDPQVSYSDPLIVSVQKALGLSREIKDLRRFLEA